MIDKKTKRLLEQLDDDNPAKRYEAVLLLGKTGNTALITPLDKVASLDEDERVRRLADKAVQTLRVLRQREEQVLRDEKLAAEGNLEWGLLTDQVQGDAPKAQKSGSFDYDTIRNRDPLEEDSDEFELDDDDNDKKAKEKSGKSDKKRKKKRRTRAGFRVILWLGVAIGTLVLIILAEQAYEDRQDDELSENEQWAKDSRGLAKQYEDAFENGSLNCPEIKPQDMALPPRPENIEDDAEFLAAVQKVETDFTDLQQQVQGVCGNFDSVRPLPPALVDRIESRINNLLTSTQEAQKASK
jgi:hypothetical protein